MDVWERVKTLDCYTEIRCTLETCECRA